jgi:hypothetical protein
LPSLRFSTVFLPQYPRDHIAAEPGNVNPPIRNFAVAKMRRRRFGIGGLTQHSRRGCGTGAAAR